MGAAAYARGSAAITRQCREMAEPARRRQDSQRWADLLRRYLYLDGEVAARARMFRCAYRQRAWAAVADHRRIGRQLQRDRSRVAARLRRAGFDLDGLSGDGAPPALRGWTP